MKSILRKSALGAFILATTAFSQAAVTLQIISDNDFAVFVGTSTGVTRLIYQNDVSWSAQVSAAGSFAFDFEPGETSIYLLAMGGGGPENIGGMMNGVDLTTIDVAQSSNLSGSLANYATSGSAIESGVYSVTFNEVSAAVPGLTWGGVSVTDNGVGTFVTGNAFEHAESSAVIYRFSAADIGVIVPAVPEPNVTLLGLATALVLVTLRRR